MPDLNSVILLLVAALTLLNTWYSRRTEKNTNSLVTRLVATTASNATRAGITEGLAQASAAADAVSTRGPVEVTIKQSPSDPVPVQDVNTKN